MGGLLSDGRRRALGTGGWQSVQSDGAYGEMTEKYKYIKHKRRVAALPTNGLIFTTSPSDEERHTPLLSVLKMIPCAPPESRLWDDVFFFLLTV